MSKNSFEIEDTIWKKDVTLVKNFPCKVRFLNAGDEIIDKNETTLYRLDVKPLEDISDKEPDILNTVLLKSSIIKILKKEKRKLINSIKSRVNRGWPTGAAKLLKKNFETVKHYKPEASRKESPENYVIAKSFKG